MPDVKSHRLGTLAPRNTRFCVLFWDQVVFCTQREFADYVIGAIGYHRAEDARIVTARQYRRR